MSEEKTLDNTKSLVPMVYYDMFAYRMLGLKYEQIADKTGYSYDWVKHLFSRGGVLYEVWENWKKTAKETNIEEAMDMMYGQLPDVMRANIVHAKTQIPGAVESRKIIFDRTMGKVADKLRLDGELKVTSFAEWIKQETLKERQQHEVQQGAIPESTN